MIFCLKINKIELLFNILIFVILFVWFSVKAGSSFGMKDTTFPRGEFDSLIKQALAYFFLWPA